VVLAALHRLVWFLIATAIGLLWSYSEQITGRQLAMQAHAVLGTIFVAALATAGYDLRQLLAWRRELSQLSESTGLSPADVRDAQRLLLVLKEQRPEKLRALRDAIRETRDEP